MNGKKGCAIFKVDDYLKIIIIKNNNKNSFVKFCHFGGVAKENIGWVFFCPMENYDYFDYFFFFNSFSLN